MPLVNIYLQNVWTDEIIKNISDDIHDVLVESFKIPEHDYNHRIIKLESSCFIHSDRKTDQYVFINIFIFPGRSKEAKRILYSGIFNKLTRYGIKENDLVVVLDEPPLENWGMKGKPGDEVDIGFNLKV
jgi:phenylpyruvate tautomerase PptA (4-oxalocrotonate tautomerase family)